MTLPSINSNEFVDSPIDYRIRPYSVGLKRHSETLATILVYKKGDKKRQSNKIDYLAQLETSVDSLTTNTANYKGSGSISEGTTDTPEGNIVTESLDGKNDYYGVYNNFSLLNVQESNKQIVKLHVNFSADWNAFFFGEQPRVYQFSGFFLDSMDYPYYQEFMVAYDKYLSGRKSIENEVQTKFIYDGKIVDGYMLNISTSQTAADQLIKNFQFTVLVKGFYWIRNNLVPRTKKELNISTSERLMTREEFNGLSNTNRLKPDKLSNPGISLNQTSNESATRRETS